MSQIINSKEAHNKYRDLLETCILQLNQFTQGKVIDLGENGFEDEAGNDIIGLDDNYVYFNGFSDTYSLHELGLLDAIKLVGDLEGTKKPAFIDLLNPEEME